MRRSSDAGAWERVYVFISSTFNDMHGERDYLVKKVFPQLADWCEARRLRLVDIDLRWGVTEQDATNNRNVVNVCLKRIDECRPFFLCFLGQRYGWVPSVEDVSSGTLAAFPGLAAAVDDRRSVTELEILHAIVSPFSVPGASVKSEHAFFYQRHPESLRRLPRTQRQLWRIYSDSVESDDASRRFLLERRRTLRRRTIPAAGRSIVVYRAQWNESARTPELEIPLSCPAVLPSNTERWQRQWRDVGVRVDALEVSGNADDQEKANAFNTALTRGRLENFTAGVESLASRIQRDLREAIELRFPGRAQRDLDTPLAHEIEQQAQFQFSAAEGFVERTGDFELLDDYARGNADRPLVIAAPAGSGKSMLVARWIDRMTSREGGDHPGLLVYRFVGASDQSFSVTAMLSVLARELMNIAGRPDDPVPADAVRLRQIWPDLLREAGERNPVCIVIDALDQLQSGLADLTWIPGRLPPGIKIVVTFRSDAQRADAASLRFRQAGAVIGSVRPFSDTNDRRRLVTAYLGQYLKELDEHHLEALIDFEGAANPLFLKIALGELRVFGSFAKLGEKVRGDFGNSPESAFNAVLRRLESDPAYTSFDPGAQTAAIFGVLSQARRGLAADELAALLCAATGRDRKDALVWDSATGATYLALRQVRPYIARRQGRFDFFYETFRLASRARYTDESGDPQGRKRSAPAWHAILADYFFALPLWSGVGAARAPNQRKTSELPYHLTMAGDGKRLSKILTDLEFIEAKCASGLTYDLVDDFARVPETMRSPQIEQFSEFVRANAHILSRWPELTFQQAANTLSPGVQEQSAPAKAAAYRQVMGFESRPWIRRLNPAPTERASLITFSGHTGSVKGVAVTPDGSRLVSIGADDTIRVWDIATGGSIEIARDVANGSAGLVLIPGSSLVAAAGSGGRIVLWDFDQLQASGELEGTHHSLTSLAVDHTGRWLAAGTSTMSAGGRSPASIVVYDLTNRSRADRGTFSQAVSAVAVAADCTVVVACGKSLHNCEAGSLRIRSSATFDSQMLTRVLISPDGRTVAVGSWGGEVRGFELASMRQTLTLPGLQAISQDLAFSPDGNEIAVGGLDGTIKIWNVSSRESLTTLRGHAGLVTGVAYTPDGERLVSSCVDGTIRLWNAQFDREFFRLAKNTFERQHAPLFSDFAGDKLALMREYLLHRMHGVRKHMNSVTALTAASADRRAVTCSIDDTVRIWALGTGECEHALEGHEHGVWAITSSNGGTKIASTDRAATIKLWDIESGRALATYSMLAGGGAAAGSDIGAQLFQELQRPRISPVKFSADDGILFTADSLDQDIKAWDATSLAPLFRLQGHAARIRSFCLVRSGSLLVSSAENGEVITWEIASRRIVARGGPRLENVAGLLGALAVTAAELVACPWPDGTLRLLEPDGLTVSRVLTPPGAPIASVECAGGRIVLVRRSDESSTIEVWSETGTTPISTTHFRSGYVTAACRRDGRRLAMGGPNETLSIHDLDGGGLARFPEAATHIAFAGDRLVAGNDIGDVFLLEQVG